MYGFPRVRWTHRSRRVCVIVLLVRLLLWLIFLSVIPDAVVIPALKDLIVDRYGASQLVAQAFLAVNLLGLFAAAPIALWLRRRWSPRRILIAAGLLDAALLLAMTLPISLEWTLTLRALEGLPDALIFGELFALIGARPLASERVRAYGAAATTLMLAIGIGITLGGAIARHAPSGATAVYIIGAIADFACVALVIRSVLPRADITTIDTDRPTELVSPSGRRLWPALLMAFSDRATGGAITSVLPLFLAKLFGSDASERGWMVGVPLMVMALGAMPSAALAARVGVRRVRITSAAIYAGSLVVIAVIPSDRAVMIPLLFILGLSGSALLPTSLALAARARRGIAGLAAFAAAGGLGQAAGLLVPLIVMAGLDATIESDRALLASFGAMHLGLTAVATIGIFRRNQFC